MKDISRSQVYRIRQDAQDFDQLELLRPSLEECVPSDAPCRWILEASMSLSVSDFIQPSLGGASYDPRRLLAVWFLALHDGLSSSRQIERFCQTDWQYRFLTGGHVPDHSTLCRFRRGLGDALPKLLAKTVSQARSRGLAQFRLVAIDGTRLPGNIDQWARVLRKVQVEGQEDPDPSDPDARCMKTRKGFINGYNAQAAVDVESGFVAMGYVTNESNDQGQLKVAVDALVDNGLKPECVLADSGYSSIAAVAKVDALGITVSLPPSIPTEWTLDASGPVCKCGANQFTKERFLRKGVRVVRWICKACKSNFNHPEGVDPGPWLRLCELAKTDEAKGRSRQRSQSIERLFSITKRRYRLREFTLRTLPLVNTQWLMVLTLRNLTLLSRQNPPFFVFSQQIPRFLVSFPEIPAQSSKTPNPNCLLRQAA